MRSWSGEERNDLARYEEVVTELTQSLNYRIAEILVCIQPGHRLRFLSLLDGLLNLLTMGGIVCPSGFQVRLG
jgi:hypothetical protein